MGINIDNLLDVQPVDTTPGSKKSGSAIDALLAPKQPTLFDKEYDMEDVSPFEAPSDSPLPEEDFFDKLNDIKEDPGQLVPFLAGGQDAMKFSKLLIAANRYKKGEESPDDINLLQDYVAESDREKTFGYKVLNVLSMLPSFAGELYATGGIATLTRTATIKAGKKVLKEIMTKTGKELLENKASKIGLKVTAEVVARTAQAPAAGLTRVWAGTQQKQLNSTINQIQTGEEKESVITSLVKAMGEQWVETVSEFSGGLLKPASKFVGNNLIKLSLFAAFKKANPAKNPSILAKIVERTGWNGVIGEMFEERVGEVAHGVLNKLGLSDQEFQIPSGEQLAVELVAFSVPGVGIAAAEQLLQKFNKIGPEGIKIEEEEPEVIDFSTPEAPVVAPGEVKPEVVPEVVPEEIKAMEEENMVFHGSADGKLKIDERGNINIGVNKEDVEKFGSVLDISRDELNIKVIDTKDELFDIGNSQEMKDDLIAQGFDTITTKEQGLIIDPEAVAKRLNLPIAKGIKDLKVEDLKDKTRPDLLKNIPEKIISNIKFYKQTGISFEGDIQPENAALRDLTALSKTEEGIRITQKSLQEAIDKKEVILNSDNTITLYRAGDPISENELVSAAYNKSATEGFIEGAKLKGKDIPLIEFKAKPEDIKIFIGKDESEVLVPKDIVQEKISEELPKETPGGIPIEYRKVEPTKKEVVKKPEKKKEVKKTKVTKKGKEYFDNFMRGVREDIKEDPDRDFASIFFGRGITFNTDIKRLYEYALTTDRGFSIEMEKQWPELKEEKPIVFDGSKRTDDFIQKKVDEGKIKIEGIEPEIKEVTGKIPASLIPRTLAWKRIIGIEMTKTTNSWGNTYFQTKAEIPAAVEKMSFELREIKKDLESLVPEGKLVPLRFVDTGKTKLDYTKRLTELVGIDGEGISKFHINLDYLKPVTKFNPNARAFTTGKDRPVVFKEDDNVVALVMPIKGVKDKDVVDIDKLDKEPIIKDDEQKSTTIKEEVADDVGSGFDELSGSVPMGTEEPGGIKGVNRGNDAEARVLEAGRGDDHIGERYEPSNELNRKIIDLIDERGDNPGAYTEEEKEMLAQYSGSGGREKEGAEGSGLLDEYYTPSDVVKLTWQSVSEFFELNKDDLTILEPSAGIGSFFTYAPEAVGEFGILDAYELDGVSARILHILHPGVSVRNTSFERKFISKNGLKNPELSNMIKNGVYDVVIGNPPYGEHRGLYKGLGEEPKIARYEEYFLKRSLDLTKEGGVVAMVMPSRFLRGGTSEAKKEIVKMAQLSRAYRLPNKAFSTTDIGTDIVIFKKMSKDYTPKGVEDLANDAYFKSFPKKILGTPTTKQGRFGEEPAVEGDLSQLKKLVAKGEKEFAKREAPVGKKISGEILTKKLVTKFDDLSIPAKTAIQAEARVKITNLGLSPEEVNPFKTEWIKKTTSINSLKIKNADVFTDTFTKRGSMTKGRIIVDKEGVVIDGNNRLRESFDKGKKTIEIFEEVATKKVAKKIAVDKKITITSTKKGKTQSVTPDIDDTLTKEEKALWTKVQPTGELDVSLEKDVVYPDANFYKGNWYNDFNYLQGNVYEKLDQLEIAKSQIPKEQYNLQKKKLESIKPTAQTMDNIILSPQDVLLDEVKLEDKTLKERFMLFLNDLSSEAFGSSSRWEIKSYVDKESVGGGSKEHNALVRVRRREIGNNIFNKFLQEGLENEEKKIVEDYYNSNRNAIVVPDYSRVPIDVKISTTLRGNPLKLRNVQKTGAGFLVNKGVGALAHEVGGGKTITSIIAVQEMVNKGWAKRPLFVVEKNNYAKWIEEINEVVPGAKVNHLANLGGEFKGDLTTFSIPEGSFSVMKVEGLRRLGFKDETYSRITSELQDIVSGITTSKRGKELEKAKIQETSGRARRGTLEDRYFEDLGFDLLVLDEAHIYKNLFTGAKVTKGEGNEYSRVRGGTSSSRAIKAFFATQYVMNNNNDRNVFLLTATPFTNNPMEYYSMLSFMAKRRLQSIGLKNVNDFMTAFMDLTTTFKVTHTQKVISSDVIERFRNANQLRKLLHEFFDFKTGDELGVLRPNKITKNFLVNPTLEQIDLFKEAEKLLQERDAGTLQYINELLNITISPFLSRYNTEPIPEDSKELIDKSPKIKLIMDLIGEAKRLNPSGGILIHSSRGLTLHKSIRDYLVEYIGYKPEEVDIISGAVKRNEQSELNTRAKFNNGEVKVLIVSDVVQRGVDLQANTTHLFRLSLPYRPDEITQIEGRAWRHGNKWANFMSSLVMMNDSIDPFLNQLLETKNKRTQEAQKKEEGSTIEAGGDVNFEELKLLLITNPKKKLEAEKTFAMASEKKKLDESKADLAFVSRKFKAYQEAREDVKERKNTVKRDRGYIEAEKKSREPDEGWMRSLEKDLVDDKQAVVRSEKKLKEVLEKLERAGDFAQIKERIDTLEIQIVDQESKVEELEEDFNKKIKEAEDVDSRIGFKEQNYQKQIDEFNLASENFFKLQAKDKTVRAPSGTATALSAPIGRYDDIGNKIGEYESDEEAQDQGLKPYQNFKLFEKVKELIQKYAKTIGQGYTPRGALGVFYTETENIRSPLNDLSVASHEITHFLDQTYQIANKVMGIKGYAINGNPIYESGSYKTRQQMTDLYEKYYPGGKRKHKLKKRMTEGFATLLQKYAQSPETITSEFPLLVSEFLKPNGKYYHTVMGEIIADLRSIIAEYQGLSELDKIGSRVVDESVNINKNDWLNVNDRIFEEVADNIYPIEKLAKITGVHFTKKDPSLVLRQYNNINQLITNNINGKRGYWGWRNGEFVKLHDFNWRTLFDRLISQKNTRDFNAFLVARNEYFLYQELEQLRELEDHTSGNEKEDKERRVRQRNIEIILRNDGFTKDEVTGAYEKNKDRFEKDVEMFDTLTKEDLSFLNDGSVQLLEKDQYDRLIQREGYASMKREFYDEIVGEEKIPSSFRVGKVRISSLIQRKGSQRPIISPLASALANHSEITKKGMKQITYNSLGNIADSAPALFQKLQLKVVPDTQGRFIFPQEKDPNIIMTRKDYKRVPILADSTIKRVYDEVLTPQSIGYFEKLITGSSRFFTKGTTGLFPAFAITNVLRDQLTAWGLTRNKFIPIYDPLHKLTKALAQKDTPYNRWLMEYLTMGGERMTLVGWQDLSPHELAIKIRGEVKGLEKAIEGLNRGMDVLAFPSKWSEIMTRAAEYIKARESGKPSIVAIEEAGRVSIPFHHIGRLGGRFGKVFIKSIPFFNPGIQVVAQSLRNLDTVKARKRMLFVFLAMNAAEIAAFGLLAAGGDDEQKQLYKDMEARELANSIYIPNPKGKTLIRIPVPNMFTFLGAMINMAILEGTNEANYKVGDYIAAGTSYMPQQFNVTEPVEAFFSWIPQIIKPAALALLNKQDWPKMRPLESQSQEAKTPGLRYTEWTSPFAKLVGGKLNLSPIKIDYLLTGYLGRATGFVTGKPGIYDPFRGINREYYFQSGRTLQEFYDLKEKNEQQYHDYKNRLIQYTPEKSNEIKRIRDRTNAINKMLGNYRDIDIDKQPDRAANLRDRILESIDELNKTL